MATPKEKGKTVVLAKKAGAVRPLRGDGYVNLLNKYGTKQDNSEGYRYQREPMIPDRTLTDLYEGNGLFARIIDLPADEAIKHGFDLNLKNDELDAFVEDALDALDWEAKATTAIKWARLYGGSIIVMLIDDGHGLEDPLDWKHIRSIDELRVYERAIAEPDSATLYEQDYGGKGPGSRVSKFGEPEYFYVSSIYGSFRVHESRCLVFRNGVLPENATNATYRYWGMPEYVRIKRALRQTLTAHADGTKLLERSVQGIYTMKGLNALLGTDAGEDKILKRLELIDTARNFMNTMAIDNDGETYDFKTFQFTGVKDIIDSTCNMLSALTSIPQTKLFGRSPAGMNATGESDLENWYSYIEGLQKLMLKRNLRNLLDIVFRAGVRSGDILEEPDYKLTFNPLWTLSQSEQAAVDQQKAATAQVKAQTAQLYVDMQAIDPSEVRRKLASDDEFDVEDIVTGEDDDDLMSALGGMESEVEAAEKTAEQQQAPGGVAQSGGQTTATATAQTQGGTQPNPTRAATDSVDTAEVETDGGPGSGNFGHGGRPGKIGGSSSEGGGSFNPDTFKNGSGDFEITGDVQDMYLTDAARARITAATAKVKTANDLKACLADKNIEVTTDYEPLKRNMDKEIPSVKQQMDYVIAAVEQYDDIGGLGSLKAVHLYDPNLEAQAQYSYKAKGEGDVADEGHLYLSDRANGFQVMHEFAHAYADSSKPDGMDVVEWSAELNKKAGLSDSSGAYFGASASDMEAERFADAMGYAFTDGNANRLQFAANVANIVNESRADDLDPTPTGVGVLVLFDGNLLIGTRANDSGSGLICGPGGHIEEGETPAQAAMRETQEEFGIEPADLMPLALLSDMGDEYGTSAVFLCTDYDGRLACKDGEMKKPMFLPLAHVVGLLEQKPEQFFPPFALSLGAVIKELFGNDLPDVESLGRIKAREDFDESEHPRDETGEFTEGSGSEKSSETESGTRAKAGAPEEVDQVDFSDESAVLSRLDEAEAELEGLDYEVNYTITTNGKVWRVSGESSTVDPSDIPDSAEGSYSYHNHPPAKTHYSFSAEDAGYFFEHKEAFAKASDDKYEYTMRRTDKTVAKSYDEVYHRFDEIRETKVRELAWYGEINMDTDEYDATMRLLSEEMGFEYERKKKTGR